jgi:pyruvate dehydrogenase E1 component
VLFGCVPNCLTYDPAFAYELAVIIQDGIRRMYQNGEDVFYYVTVENENYAQPPMPAAGRAEIIDGILKGIYRLKSVENPAVQLWGSGAILNEAIRAQEILQEKFGVAANVWSVTSYNELRRDAVAVERRNRLHPAEAPQTPYIQQVMSGTEGPIIAASDYMKVVADQLSPWLGGRLTALGTDGFGRSENREMLRRHFEVDAESIAAAALAQLALQGKFDKQRAAEALRELGINADKADPVRA